MLQNLREINKIGTLITTSYDMKLPTPRKRGNSYLVEIMIDGKRYSATRDTASEKAQAFLKSF